MFWIFFQDWFSISVPNTKTPFSDFMASCSQTTKEVYVSYTKWWVVQYEKINKKIETDCG